MSANGQPWNRSAAGVIGRLASLALGVWCVSVLAAGLRNPGFTISDPSSAAYGWTTNGTVTVGSGQALIAEDGVHLPVRLSQSFVLSSNVTRIHITLQTLNLSANDPGQPMDAFQISLLDGANNSPVPTTGQDGTSAFFSFQRDGRAYFGSTTTVPVPVPAAASGRRRSRRSSRSMFPRSPPTPTPCFRLTCWASTRQAAAWCWPVSGWKESNQLPLPTQCPPLRMFPLCLPCWPMTPRTRARR
jgi:hypothetical protein